MSRRLSRPKSTKVAPGASAKGRGEAVPQELQPDAPARPLANDPPGTSWAIFAKNRRAERAWRDLCATMPGPCQRAYDQLAVDPFHEDGHRWIELAGRFLGIRQHELGGGQRIWYRVDAGQRIVIIEPYTSHPKQTERKNR